MIVLTVKIAASILIGFFAGPAAVYVFNHMPDSWLCDYGQDRPVPVRAPSRSDRHGGAGNPGRKSNQGSPDGPGYSGEPGYRSGANSPGGQGSTDTRNSAETLNAPEKRMKENPWRWVYSAGFICLCLRLSLVEYGDGFLSVSREVSIASAQVAFAGLVACWLLLVIALADLKYMIIPDQFVLLLALSSIGFIPLYKSGGAFGAAQAAAQPAVPEFWQTLTDLGLAQPLTGMVIGGGFMLLCAVAGKLIFRQDAFGFGDVKLCAAMGLVLGINGTVASVAAAIIISGFAAAAGLATKRLKPDDQRPLGPYLCGCAMAYILVFTGQVTL